MRPIHNLWFLGGIDMDFTERSVLVLIKSKPFGKIINFEGWRVAVGMFGMDHESTMLCIGDGVYSLLKNMNDMPIRMFKSVYKSFDGRICVSEKSLDERGINPDELIEEAEILEEPGISTLLNENEIILSF
jgi:sulfur relay (sulfurtransferase) DsrF/TusC family protein